MDEVKIIPEKDYDRFMDIIINAYPGAYGDLKQEDREKIKKRSLLIQKEDPTIDFYGLYRNKQLLGVMRLHDFTMNMRSKMIKSWGIGLVAVDLIHKKEKVAKEIMSFYLNYLEKKDVSLAILYPFRSDFYKEMGFGYGTKMNSYYFKPSSLPHNSEKENISYLNLDNISDIHKCYMKYTENTHGMTGRSSKYFEMRIKNPKNKFIGYKSNGSLDGYLIFQFKKLKDDNFIFNDIVIIELIYNNSKSLHALTNFLHKQADQINRISFATQDTNFHYILSDARNGTNNLLSFDYVSQEINTQGRGIMYRVVNIPSFFDKLTSIKFGNNTLILKLTITDTFMPKNNGSFHLKIENGFIKLIDQANYDVEIKLGIADFSSMVTGSITFKELVIYGLASISDTRQVRIINDTFKVDSQPICMASF
ncbi:MAG: GNAT family N-acetyltransferase [Candidatus Hodarchaeales archaeon]|jgi:predicted acetyltransferase